MKTYHDFVLKTEEYASEWRKKGLEKFQISERYDLFPEKIIQEKYSTRHKWPELWPHANNPGVYGIFCKDNRLLYVGKASMNSSIGKRLSAYFLYAKDSKCRIRYEKYVASRFVAVVAVPAGSPWEAPALEEFLIKLLDPPLNKNGR